MNNFFYLLYISALFDSNRSERGGDYDLGEMIFQVFLFLIKCAAVLIPAFILLWIAALLVAYQPWYVFMPIFVAPFILWWIVQKSLSFQIKKLSLNGFSIEKSNDIAFKNILYIVGITLFIVFCLGLFLFIYSNADDKMHPISQAFGGVIGFLCPFIIAVAFFWLKKAVKSYFLGIRQRRDSR